MHFFATFFCCFSVVLLASAQAEDIAFTDAPGFHLDTVLREPDVKQPLFLNFDERGRLWVVQYRQFPFPKGLKVLGHDKYWRIQYENFPPPPPPNHIEGQDVVSIFVDEDDDGAFAHQADFVSGLNICTAALPGRGGVWVLNPPYLLFYPDANRDDVPDGDPAVHLAGFGLEDLHAVANGLRWGPDGWLYGFQGSTTTANITRPGFDGSLAFEGQNLWRYHPEDKRFELFAEGGYNNFGLALDAHGDWFTGSNAGNIGTHQVQGGYSWKNWGKHGELTNPHAFGFFQPMEDHSTRAKLSQAMVSYDAPQFPAEYRGKLLTARALQRRISAVRLEPRGSTYAAFEDDQQLVTTEDEHFRPVGMTQGPDGAVYIADWHDTNITWSVSAEADRVERETGRVYRLRHGDPVPVESFDLAARSGDELVQLLDHENKWYRETALRLIFDRHDETLLPQLTALLRANTGQLALEALWAVNACGGFTLDLALDALDHPNADVRRWTIRLLGDDDNLNLPLAKKLALLGANEPDPKVRSQLASTAKRLVPDHGLPILHAMLQSNQDQDDPHIPLLLWWAVEGQLRTDQESTLACLLDVSESSHAVLDETIWPRLGKRFAIDHRVEDFQAAALLLDHAPQAAQRQAFLAGFAEGLGNGPVETSSRVLRDTLKRLRDDDPDNTQLLIIAARLGDTEALERAMAHMADNAVAVPQRVALMELLGDLRHEAAREPLLAVFTSDNALTLRQGALNALQHYPNPEVGDALIAALAKEDPLQSRIAAALVSRTAWATRLLDAVDAGIVAPEKIDRDLLANLAALGNPAIDAQVRKHWGTIRQSADEALARVNGIYARVKNGPGNPAVGVDVFQESCGKCHVLHGIGRAVGPELTGIDRSNLWNLVTDIIDPNRSILPEYVGTTFTVRGEDEGFGPENRVINGFLLHETDQGITIVDTAGNELTVPMENVESMVPMQVSVMPEGLLDGMSDQKLRDLFSFLQSDGR